MAAKPKRRALPKPSAFRLKDRWVCDYYTFDEASNPLAQRKSFVRELQTADENTSVSRQRTAALTFRDEKLRELKEQEKMERREREQPYLSLRELKEAEAAFAIFNQIPYRGKSLVDAVV